MKEVAPPHRRASAHCPGDGRAPEMRLRDRPIVEAEHGFDAAVQFVRQMDASDPPAIRAAGMLEPLQVYAERGVELSDRS